MMFQDLNSSYQYGESSNNAANQHLRTMHDGRYLHSVPDINLECDETIENWQEIDNYMFDNKQNEKYHIYSVTNQEANTDDESSEFYNNYPPPNSPAKGIQIDEPLLQLHNQYVSNLLQVWRDSQNSSCNTQETNENSDGYSLPSDDRQSSQDSNDSSEDHNLVLDDEMITESETDGPATSNNNIVIQELNDNMFGMAAQAEQFNGIPQSSSRSTSPTVIEMLSHFRQNVMNFRSVSPLIVRSPSPISSRSSSPRFVHSPSPLQFLEHSMSSLPLDDSTEIVFYDDHYIVRSYSPVSAVQGDHQVPDVNMDFQQTVSDSEEFPSFRLFGQRRIQNSCQDQVVPEYIEE